MFPCTMCSVMNTDPSKIQSDRMQPPQSEVGHTELMRSRLTYGATWSGRSSELIGNGSLCGQVSSANVTRMQCRMSVSHSYNLFTSTTIRTSKSQYFCSIDCIDICVNKTALNGHSSWHFTGKLTSLNSRIEKMNVFGPKCVPHELCV